LAITKFIFNNKVHTATKSSSFKVNYRREPRMGFEIRKKRKYVKVEEFVKEVKEMYEKAKTVVKKIQKEMKKYADRNKKKVVEYKERDKVLLSIKEYSK